MQSQNTSCPCSVSQHAAIAALKVPKVTLPPPPCLLPLFLSPSPRTACDADPPPHPAVQSFQEEAIANFREKRDYVLRR